MKINRLLTPLLGLTAVATVVMPTVTSCGSKAEVKHVKSSPIDEITPKNGIAQYLLILDNNDYEATGFKVEVKVADDDKTGAKSSDFAIDSWTLDGNHLIVDVKYLLEGEQAYKQDANVKLNLVVNYGSKWKQSLAVKFDYVATKGIELTYDSEYDMYITEEFNVFEGETYTLACNYVTDIKVGDPIFLDFYSLVERGAVAFKNITVSCDGKELVKDVDYTLRYRDDDLCAVQFSRDKHPTVNSKLTFKFVDCQTTTTCRARLYNNAA